MAHDQPPIDRSAIGGPARSLPMRWLISDARNDCQIESALARLERGSGFIFRHYHLDEEARYRRFAQLARVARRHGHLVILADSALTAREWGADGIYGAPRALYPRRKRPLRLATAHNLAEIGMAARLGADAVLLSPVFATRSHPQAKPLGAVRLRLLANRAVMPVIALGGMSGAHAARSRWKRWAAIDGLA